MSVFSSEFWRSFYFLGMGGQASEADPNAMFGLFTGMASFTGVLTGIGEAVPGGGRKVIPKRGRVSYADWVTEEDLPEVSDTPLPVAVRKKLPAKKEAERVNNILLKAMKVASGEATRKEVAALRSEVKQAKAQVPDTEAELRAMVVWLVKRAEALREAEEDDEDAILLLVA